MRSRVPVAATAVTAVAALVLPSAASAHVAGVEYKFPLPVWLYAVAGVAVLASAPAAALAVRDDEDWASRSFYSPLARLRLGVGGLALALFVLTAIVVGVSSARSCSVRRRYETPASIAVAAAACVEFHEIVARVVDLQGRVVDAEAAFE